MEEVREEAGGESMKPPEGVSAMVDVDEGGRIDEGRRKGEERSGI